MMSKNRIRLTESDLHRVIKESVKRILKEKKDTTFVDVLKDAKIIYNNIMKEMNSIGGCPVEVNFGYGRDDMADGRMSIWVDVDFPKNDNEENLWRVLIEKLEDANFLNIGDGRYMYMDDRLTPMGNVHDERYHNRYFYGWNDPERQRRFYDLAMDSPKWNEYMRNKYGLDESIRRAIKKALH